MLIDVEDRSGVGMTIGYRIAAMEYKFPPGYAACLIGLASTHDGINYAWFQFVPIYVVLYIYIYIYIL